MRFDTLTNMQKAYRFLSFIFLLISIQFAWGQPPKTGGAPTPKAVPTPAANTGAAATPPNGKAFMYLIGMQINDMKDVSLCYSTQNDLNRIKIEYEVDDTINILEDFALSEDPMPSPDCFVPELKLIFKNYTYVVSMYCTSVVMFKNSAPYTPSPTKLKTDLEITESVYTFLNKQKKKNFPTLKIKPEILAKIKIDKPVNIEDDSEGRELDALLQQDEDDDNPDKDVNVEDQGEFDQIEIEEKDPDEEAPKK